MIIARKAFTDMGTGELGLGDFSMPWPEDITTALVIQGQASKGTEPVLPCKVVRGLRDQFKAEIESQQRQLKKAFDEVWTQLLPNSCSSLALPVPVT